MRTECRRCGRLVWRWPWQSPFCPASDIDGCLNAYLSMVEPPPAPTTDDPPPSDMHVCPACGGRRDIVTRRDFTTGAIEVARCARCEGTGVFPVA